MKPKRPVIICLASSTWVVVVPELSGLQFWIAQMPVRATAVMNPNLRPGLLVMRCMASAIGTRCKSADEMGHASNQSDTMLLPTSFLLLLKRFLQQVPL